MKHLKRYWRIIFPIFFIVIIWLFSAMNGEASENQSLGIANWLHLPHDLMRKLAHIVLFAGLGYSISSFQKGLAIFDYPNTHTLWWSSIIVLLYGIIDEVHQSFVPGRNASGGDVFVDLVAGFAGILLYIAIFCFIRRWRLKRLVKKANK